MSCNFSPAVLFGFSVCWTGSLWAIARFLTRNSHVSRYPFALSTIAFFAVGTLFYLFQLPSQFFVAYSLFFSALIVTMFTDATTLLISQLVTLYLVPVGWMLANLNLLPISPLSSIAGSLCGLLLLWLVRKLSQKFLHKEGLGQGDVDLLCFIGAFTGPLGCWITLMVGSILASLVGLIYFIASRAKQDIMLPFGLFLSMAAILYVFFEKQLIAFFLPL